MAISLAHKAIAHLVVAIAISDTAIKIDAQAFESFIRLPGDEVFAILRGPIDREIVKIDISGSSNQILAVERGQGGTTAKAWPVGTLIFGSTHEDFYNALIQAGGNRTIDYNPNEILTPLHAGEKVYQSGGAGCERWWKSFNGVDPYWDIITGAKCGTENYEDIGWTYDLLIQGPPWTLKHTFEYTDPVRWIYSLCYDSSRYNLFAGTKYGAHIFKSADGGANWSHCYDTNQDEVQSLVYDAYHDVIVAGTGNAGHWYRSTDGGDNWSLITGLCHTVNCIVYAPDTHTLIAGTYTSAKIFKSTDGGASWTEKQNLGTDSPYEAHVLSMTYDSYRSNFVCGTGLNNGGIWVSTDDGDTWTLKKSLGSEADPQTRVESLAYDSENDVLVAGTYNDGQIWRSLDGGDNWSFVKDLSDESPGQYSVDDMIFIPGSNIILAGTAYNAQVWLSENGGASWAMEQDLANYTIYAFAHDLYRNKVVVATSSSFSEDCDIWTRDD